MPFVPCLSIFGPAGLPCLPILPFSRPCRLCRFSIVAFYFFTRSTSRIYYRMRNFPLRNISSGPDSHIGLRYPVTGLPSGSGSRCDGSELIAIFRIFLPIYVISRAQISWIPYHIRPIPTRRSIPWGAYRAIPANAHVVSARIGMRPLNPK